MKPVVIVSTLAALWLPLLAAQRGQEPAPELAAVIAVEEQERDLAKAERLYRELLAGDKLAPPVRSEAQLRLGRLLQRLGRVDEAKAMLQAAKGDGVGFDDVTPAAMPQDAERAATLRARARDLVQQVLDQSPTATAPNSPLSGITDPDVANQLLWLGEAAVPEVAGALTEELKRLDDGGKPRASSTVVSGLSGFLWQVGSETAAAHLRQLLRGRDAAERAMLYECAFQFREARMAQLVVQFARDETDEALASFLVTRQNTWPRLDLDARVDLLVQRGARFRTAVLPMLGWDSVKLTPELLAKVHAVARDALQGSDPELGRAAQQFVVSQNSQGSGMGIELLVQQLPALRNLPTLRVAPMPADWLVGESLDPKAAARLWPQLVQQALTMTPGDHRPSWLGEWLSRCAGVLDSRIVPDVLAMASFTAWPPHVDMLSLLHGKVTTANAAEVFAVYDKLPGPAPRESLLRVLRQLDELPVELYGPLAQRAAAVAPGDADTRRRFVSLLALTGHPDAAAAVVAEWRANSANNKGTEAYNPWQLVRLGRRTQAEPVRAAMREVAGAWDSPVQRTPLLLALLSMHDLPTLELVAVAGDLPAARHPYAKTPSAPSSPGLTPLQYLLYDKPDPPHGFTEDEILGLLPKLFAGQRHWQNLGYRHFSFDAIPDRVLGEFVRLFVTEQRPHTTDQEHEQWGWVEIVCRRARETGDSGPLRDWVKRSLQQPHPRLLLGVLRALEPDEVLTHQRAITTLLDAEDEEVAVVAMQRLLEANAAPAPDQLARNPHERVRRLLLERIAEGKVTDQDTLVLPLLRDRERNVRVAAAECAGALVLKAAVPALLDLLRDSDEQVRTAATEALTRIRFYHEQQAHWDRVLKGIDATAASAAEKLLLQARPGASKAQRLLAIRSLGTLGVPEALPFLIDWTQDPDAEVQAAANAAITQIHLNPKR